MSDVQGFDGLFLHGDERHASRSLYFSLEAFVAIQSLDFIYLVGCPSFSFLGLVLPAPDVYG